jgi:RNA polymerase sigma-70 factor (ECF subfamily)
MELPSALQRLSLNIEVVTETTDSWEDAEDIGQTLAGDEDAFRRLIERHEDWVAARMWRFTRDEPTHAELVQDVFVEAWRSLSTYREKAPFSHWLARIATRVGYRYWKRREKERTRAEHLMQLPEPYLGEDAGEDDVREAAETLYRLLDALPPRDRLVLTLRYVEDLDVRETARRCGWSVSMVKVQTFRAREKLKKLYEMMERRRDND